MDWQPRLAREGDIPQLEAPISVSIKRLQVHHYSRAQIETALGSVFGVDRQLIRDETYFVVEREGQIIGCGGWSKRKTLFGGDAIKTRMDMELDLKRDSARSLVHPAWARCRIARTILERCEKAIRLAGFRDVELVATLTGELFYEASCYSQGVRFEIPLANGLSLPVVRIVKQL